MIVIIAIGIIIVLALCFSRATPGAKPVSELTSRPTTQSVVPFETTTRLGTRKSAVRNVLALVPAQRGMPASPTVDVEDSPIRLAPGPRVTPEVIYPEFDFYSPQSGGRLYPPDWDARKAAVRVRDGERCQVTGCPSLCKLDVHHRQLVSEGGSHRLDNLVCLCLVHHWLLPNHSLVAERTNAEDSQRFTMRRAHSRWHPTRPVRVNVRATFERYQIASIDDCERIRDFYNLRCRVCESEGIHFASIAGALISACLGCRKAWNHPKLLPEEIGPILAEYYLATKNIGSFQLDPSLLGDHPRQSALLCFDCADRAEIQVLLPRNGRNGPFRGCANYPSCTNTDDRQRRKFGNTFA